MLGERAVDLDRMHERDAVGEVARQDAEPGADLEHDVVRLEPGEPSDHAEDVLVDEEVLAELLLRADRHSEKQRVAFASSCVASASGSSLRARASTATVCTTFAAVRTSPRTSCTPSPCSRVRV